MCIISLDIEEFCCFCNTFLSFISKYIVCINNFFSQNFYCVYIQHLLVLFFSLRADQLVYIGLRDIDPYEAYILNKLGIRAYAMDVSMLLYVLVCVYVCL